MACLSYALSLALLVACLATTDFELPDLKGASDTLVEIVRSDEFDALFQQGKRKVNGLTLLRHVEENSKLSGENFEYLFRRLLGAESMQDLENKRYSWNQATNVLNAIIKLSDNISVNESRKPNSKYKSEDDRITLAKKHRKEKRKAAAEKDEL